MRRQRKDLAGQFSVGRTGQVEKVRVLMVLIEDVRGPVLYIRSCDYRNGIFGKLGS
jgi:hypothetical protein